VGPASRRKIHNLTHIVWYKEEIPVDWKMRINSPIYKRDYPNKLENYRRINFLIFMYKVLSTMIWNRLTEYTKNNWLLPKWIQKE